MYPAKITLFGEFGSALNSMSLIAPTKIFHGDLHFFKMGKSTGTQIESNRILNRYTEHLSKLSTSHFDLKKLAIDLSEGLYFEHNIPISGNFGLFNAISSAIYQEYCTNKKNHMEELITDFTSMDSFYDKRLNSADTLSIYLNKPILANGNLYRILSSKDLKKNNYKLFLYKRKQMDYLNGIEIFEEKMNDLSFQSLIEKDYKKIVENCIRTYKLRSPVKFKYFLKKLIVFQLEHLNFSTDQKTLKFMNEGMKKKLFYLKLHGTDGNYYLGFTKKLEETTTYFTENNSEIYPLNIL